MPFPHPSVNEPLLPFLLHFSGVGWNSHMDGFWESLGKWFNEKTGSPLYFTYIGFFIAWNWQFFHVLFIESESLFKVPTVEYVTRHMLISTENVLAGSPAWVITAVNWVVNLGWHVLPPAALTIFTILYLPPVQKWALAKYLDSRFDRKRMYALRQKEHNEWLLGQEKKDVKTLEELASVKERQVETTARIESLMTDEEKWAHDFTDFLKLPLRNEFSKIVESVYNHQGNIRVTDEYERETFSIPKDLLAYAHTTNLISFDQINGSIDLTEKGKFFVRKYTEGEMSPF